MTVAPSVWAVCGCKVVLGVFMSKKKARRGRSSTGKKHQRNRSLATVSHSAQSGARGDTGVSSWRQIAVSRILGNPLLVEYVQAHPLQSLLCQMGLFSVVAAAAGALIARYVPQVSDGDVGKGIYVAGVVGILMVETIYQWLVRAATLPVEEGAVTLMGRLDPSISGRRFRAALEQVRDKNEPRLARLFEPLLRVGLVALALSVHFVAQTSGKLPSPPLWAEILSQDWAMTVMFGLAGLLWQLKNPDNIGKLLVGFGIQKHIAAFGDYFWPAIVVGTSVGSIVVLYLFFPLWGWIGTLPLIFMLWFFIRFLSRRSSR